MWRQNHKYMGMIDFIAGVGLYVGILHPKIRHTVKPLCKILQKIGCIEENIWISGA